MKSSLKLGFCPLESQIFVHLAFFFYTSQWPSEVKWVACTLMWCIGLLLMPQFLNLCLFVC